MQFHIHENYFHSKRRHSLPSRVLFDNPLSKLSFWQPLVFQQLHIYFSHWIYYIVVVIICCMAVSLIEWAPWGQINIILIITHFVLDIWLMLNDYQLNKNNEEAHYESVFLVRLHLLIFFDCFVDLTWVHILYQKK